MKKVVSIILACIFLTISINNVVFAASNDNQIISPYWENVSSITGYVDKNEGVFWAMISGYSGVTKITVTATLYYKNSSNRWVEIPTDWEYSVNSASLNIYEEFDANPGTTYKVVLEADVYANGYTESITREFT